MFDDLKFWARIGFEHGRNIGKRLKRRKGQAYMAAIGGIAGIILLLYVILLVISKFRPTIVSNIQASNDTVANEMLTEVDSNTKSSLSFSSMVPFIIAVSIVLGVLFQIFRG